MVLAIPKADTQPDAALGAGCRSCQRRLCRLFQACSYYDCMAHGYTHDVNDTILPVYVLCICTYVFMFCCVLVLYHTISERMHGICTGTYAHVYINTCVPACMHTHIYIHMYVYIHKDIRTHMSMTHTTYVYVQACNA